MEVGVGKANDARDHGRRPPACGEAELMDVVHAAIIVGIVGGIAAIIAAIVVVLVLLARRGFPAATRSQSPPRDEPPPR